MAAAQSMRWVSGNSHAKQPDYSLEPTLLAGENATVCCLPGCAKTGEREPEPSGGSARGR